jgi:hypothetical protein
MLSFNRKNNKSTKAEGAKQKAIEMFFQPPPKRLHDGSLTITVLPKYPVMTCVSDRKIKCKAPSCKSSFLNTQGLGSHLNKCEL